MDHINDIQKQLIDGYMLTTAEIIYHLPDMPHLLQSYIWQEYDFAPRFPVLNEFLHFWTKEIDGPLHSVIVAKQKIITEKDFYHYSGEYALN